MIAEQSTCSGRVEHQVYRSWVAGACSLKEPLGLVKNARPPAPLALPAAGILNAGITYGAMAIERLAFIVGAHAGVGEHGGGAERGKRGDD